MRGSEADVEIKPRLAPGFRSCAGDGLLLERHRRLAVRHIGRDRRLVGAQVAEQRAPVRESYLPQAAPERRHRRCDDRSRLDHRHDTVTIRSDLCAAVPRMPPTETRMPRRSRIVAEEIGPIGEEAVVVEDTAIVEKALIVDARVDVAACDAADVGDAGVVAIAAAGAGGGISRREHGEADGGRSGDCKQCRVFQHGELLEGADEQLGG